MTKQSPNDGYILAGKCPELEGAGLILYFIIFDKRAQQISTTVSVCCLSLRWKLSQISATSAAGKWCKSQCRPLLTLVQHDAVAGPGAALAILSDPGFGKLQKGGTTSSTLSVDRGDSKILVQFKRLLGVYETSMA
jgi:hypothetical protein